MSKPITIEIDDPLLIEQIDLIINELGATRQEVISGIITFGILELLKFTGDNHTTENKRAKLQLVKK